MAEETTLTAVKVLKEANPTWGARKIANALNAKPSTVQGWMAKVSRETKPNIEALANMALRFLQKSATSPSNLAEALGVDVETLDEVLARLAETHNLDTSGTLLTLTKPNFGRIPFAVAAGGERVCVGLVGDTHLGCEEERLDALHAQYDLFEAEGITHVFHAGNIVDGYIPRINGATAIVTTPDDQAQYVIDQYPRRKGITTFYITGDDHEGWWIKEGFNWGAYLASMARDQGRDDLKYIGHVEADVEFETGGTPAIMKVQHPGGGSSYARSYTGQKQVEAFQGGEKPQILVQGHYHVSNYMNDRNVHVISLPGFQDQTVFARKKRLRMEVGGVILSFNPREDGSVARVSVEFNMFFDRGYYRKFIRSDAKVIKGALRIPRK